MGPREHGDVHGHVDGVGLVQAHAEVPLAAQQQQDEHADVHESDAGCGREPITSGQCASAEGTAGEEGRDSH